jgi:hypothetical protein
MSRRRCGDESQPRPEWSVDDDVGSTTGLDDGGSCKDPFRILNRGNPDLMEKGV